ncbi:hypothetical protein ABQF34_03645 [Mycolicibacterium boenickei]
MTAQGRSVHLMRWTALVAGALLSVGLIAACGVAKKIDTDPLETEISAMPGVTRAWVTFDDHELDSIVTLNAQMAEASADQIADVVQAVEAQRSDGSAWYLERLRLRVGDGPMVSVLRDAQSLNATDIVADAEALRGFARAISATSPKAQIDSENDERVMVRQLTTPVPDTLQAARDTLGDRVSRMYLLSADTNVAHWEVTLPLTRDQEQRIQEQIAKMPAQLDSIAVQGGTVSELGVIVNSPTPDRDLAAIIDIVGAGPNQPLWLTWHMAPRNLTQQYDGSVDVGGCDYPDSRLEQLPEKYLSASEIRLQDDLRRRFDTCPR